MFFPLVSLTIEFSLEMFFAHCFQFLLLKFLFLYGRPRSVESVRCIHSPGPSAKKVKITPPAKRPHQEAESSDDDVVFVKSSPKKKRVKREMLESDSEGESWGDALKPAAKPDVNGRVWDVITIDGSDEEDNGGRLFDMEKMKAAELAQKRVDKGKKKKETV